MYILDTNILLRALLQDDGEQAQAAINVLRDQSDVCIPITALCEYVWVLRRLYKMPRADVAASIRSLLRASNIVVDRLAAQKGLAVLEAGGDFADAVLGFEGRWLGGDEFVTFDKQAAALLPKVGIHTRLLTSSRPSDQSS